MKFKGFIVDCFCPSESRLEVEIDASKLDWSEYRKLVEELEDILSDIDERHSIKSDLTRGRSLRARYSRVTKDFRTRKLRFSPFPSKYRNVLSNTRAVVYGIIGYHCIAISKVGNRKVYFLPEDVAPSFLESIESVNQNIRKMKEEIKEFRNTKDWLDIGACLHKYGIDPNILNRYDFHISEYVVDLIPIDMDYTVDESRWRDDVRGVELLKKELERKKREYTIASVKDISNKVMDIIDAFGEAKRLKYLSRKIEKLIDLCRSVGMNDVVDKLLKPLMEICNAPSHKRKHMLSDFRKRIKEIYRELFT